MIRHLGTNGVNGAPAGCQLGNQFDENRYEAPANWFKYKRMMWCGNVTWSQFQDSGHEAGGTAVTRS